MVQSPFRRFAAALLITVAATVLPTEAARQGQSTATVETPKPTKALTKPVISDERDARETRGRLKSLLDRYPPNVARVLKLDPSLLTNESYLAAYPALAAFMTEHQEVAHNPGFFFENIYLTGYEQPPDRQTAALNMWRNTIEGIGILIIFLTITLVLVWMVRSLIEYRRWHRMSKVHAEVHSRLLDRFTSNEDLMAFVQTPAGRTFLESSPLPGERIRPIAAPFTRILWSVQAGVVLATAALGLLFVSTRAIEEVAPVLFGVGVLALAVGLGFVISAAVSFLLSRRLGLFEPTLGAREHSGPTGV